jgi:hypothetical protein
MFKFYVLWSRFTDNLENVLSNLPLDNTVVIINTLRTLHEDAGVAFCKERNIEYHVTESDGTPGTGKNSLLEKFLESDNQYMVAIDGDDFLTPHGVNLYQRLAEHKSPPDIVCLYRQLGVRGCHPDVFRNKNPDLTRYNLEYPFDKTKVILDYDSLMEIFTDPDYNQSNEVAHEWAVGRLRFDSFMRKYSESEEFMCRLVFHSRKAAEIMKYTNELYVGEDTVQYLKLKKQSLDGNIKMMRRKERNNPTYIYNRDLNGMMLGKFQHDWSWCIPLLDVLYNDSEILGIPERTNLPEFRDSEWV